MFGCKPCATSDPATDTVKVVMNLDGGDEPKRAEEESKRQQEEEKKRAAEAEKARKAVEDKRLREQIEEKRRIEEEEAKAAAAEANRLEEEEAARQEEERKKKAEAERLRKQQEEKAAREREAAEEAERKRVEDEKAKAELVLKEALTVWLKKNKLADANAKKKSMFNHCYPLHVAVSQKDLQIVRALLVCGADKNTPNSGGQTPLELATKSNKNGSHDEIIAALQ